MAISLRITKNDQIMGRTAKEVVYIWRKINTETSTGLDHTVRDFPKSRKTPPSMIVTPEVCIILLAEKNQLDDAVSESVVCYGLKT
jgi:hypothetical protein